MSEFRIFLLAIFNNIIKLLVSLWSFLYTISSYHWMRILIIKCSSRWILENCAHPLKISSCVCDDLVGNIASGLGWVNAFESVASRTISASQRTADIDLAGVLLSHAADERVSVAQVRWLKLRLAVVLRQHGNRCVLHQSITKMNCKQLISIVDNP